MRCLWTHEMACTCAPPSWRLIQRHLSVHPRAILASPQQAVYVWNRPHAPSRSIHQSRALLLFEWDDIKPESQERQGENQKPQIDRPEQDNPRGTQHDFAKLRENLFYPANSELSHFIVGKKVSVNGFLSSRRLQSSKLVFADIETPMDFKVQVIAKCDDSLEGDHEKLLDDLRQVPLHSAVSVTGLAEKIEKETDYLGQKGIAKVLIHLQKIQVLNAFPKDISMARDKQFSENDRHLQIRMSTRLRNRLKFRAFLAQSMRKTLEKLHITEYETPLLFKSTPEGAREFLVPTRRRGHAFALPQSPQQFKQILMASGIPAYYQFARCFRDEDLRADRQPEFTQLDLELAFATKNQVIELVEKILVNVSVDLRPVWGLHENAPVYLREWEDEVHTRHFKFRKDGFPRPFPRMTYQEAMETYGTDKPDLRIPWKLQQVHHVLREGFVRMITKLKNPCVDAFVFRPNWDVHASKRDRIGHEIRKFVDSLPPELRQNPDGKPAMLVYDSRQPLNGLAPLGHESAEKIAPLFGLDPGLEDGDYIFFQARVDRAFRGEGSTALGQLSTLLYTEAINRGWLPVPRSGHFCWLWVTDFPLFTPVTADADEPGQGGRTGLRATHHPFTAPKGPDDLEEVLYGDPLRALADHYDLVVNGIELGGGSRRIHVASLQEHVLRNVLGMPPEGVAHFDHLLRALRAGCPPHAGFALGFDRLAALLSAAPSVRNVMAFPKTARARDPMTKSPGVVPPEQWWPYHLMPTHVPNFTGALPYKDVPQDLVEKARAETLGWQEDEDEDDGSKYGEQRSYEEGERRVEKGPQGAADQ